MDEALCCSGYSKGTTPEAVLWKLLAILSNDCITLFGPQPTYSDIPLSLKADLPLPLCGMGIGGIALGKLCGCLTDSKSGYREKLLSAKSYCEAAGD